jgi:hypothetical protein
MHIDQHNAGTALQLTNSALSAAKSLFELGKKTSDHELKHQIGDVLDSI